MVGKWLVGILLVQLTPLGAALRLVGQSSSSLRVIVDGTRPHRKKTRHGAGGSVGSATNVSGVSDPVLLCFMVVQPGTHDVDLLQLHLHLPMLSGCDRFLVYSNVSLSKLLGSKLDFSGQTLLEGLPDSAVISGSMSHGWDGWPPEKPIRYTAANSPSFLPVWRSLLPTKIYLNFDWTVKLDPDTVFFPERTRELLKARPQDEAVAIFDGGSMCPNSDGMGGISLVSKGLMTALDTNFEAFVERGQLVVREDGWLSSATDTWGRKIEEPNLLENTVHPPCGKLPWKAAYHPIKDPSTMNLCFQEQKNFVSPAPALLNSVCL